MKKAVLITLIAVSVTLNIKYLTNKIIYRPGPPAVNDSTITYTLNESKYTASRVGVFSIIPKNEKPIVFLGNSLTEGFPLKELYPNLPVENRGIGGNTIQDILRRLDQIISEHPSKLFFEAGVNDLAKTNTIEQVYGNFSTVVSEIRKRSPSTVLYIQSVLPTCFDHVSSNDKINKYNAMIKRYADSANIAYVNLHDRFLVGDKMDSTMSYDGVHLNGFGYALWKKAIDSLVIDVADIKHLSTPPPVL